MKVKNHKEFARFNYTNTSSNAMQLGDVVIKRREGGILLEKPEIGVVIQTQSNEEFRTDMYGNTYNEQSVLATREEIELYRPELLTKLAEQLVMKTVTEKEYLKAKGIVKEYENPTLTIQVKKYRKHHWHNIIPKEAVLNAKQATYMDLVYCDKPNKNPDKYVWCEYGNECGVILKSDCIIL